MTRPLSLDLGQRVVDAINAGRSGRAAAARFGIAPSGAAKGGRLWRETGSGDADGTRWRRADDRAGGVGGRTHQRATRIEVSR